MRLLSHRWVRRGCSGEPPLVPSLPVPDHPTELTSVPVGAATDLKLQLYGRTPPAALLAALDADPALGPAIAALSAKDKAALLDRLFDTNDPARQAERMDQAARTILEQAAGRRSTPLEPLAQPTTLVDAILAELVAPALKAEGFKKKGRTWTRVDDAGTRCVEVHAPSAGSLRARFAIAVWGQSQTDRYRLGLRLDEVRRDYQRGYEFEVDDDHAQHRVRAEVESDWNDIGLPMVHALPDAVGVADVLFAVAASQIHLDAVRRHLGDAPRELEMARRIDDRYFSSAPGFQAPDSALFDPLSISLPDHLSRLRSRLRRMLAADRPIPAEERAEVDAFTRRCRAALETEPDIADADAGDERARRAVALARRTDRDLRHGSGRSAEALAEIDGLLDAIPTAD